MQYLNSIQLQYMSFEDLPRDLQLRILAASDIDTRRALGIFFRLRVPETVKDKLSAVLNKRVDESFNEQSQYGVPPRKWRVKAELGKDNNLYSIMTIARAFDDSDVEVSKSIIRKTTNPGSLFRIIETELWFDYRSTFNPLYIHPHLKKLSTISSL